ncbi:hypothetical protein ACQEVF_59655 [Nonomuraea polychroma]|uniref:hypothetical protein n=1 Tax=Nonomuraea polychroma TaxID=46176 RepID=UPI003D916F4D
MTTADEIVAAAAQAGGEELPAKMRPCKIDITNEDEAVRMIAKAIHSETGIPGLYVRGGEIVEVAEIDPGTGTKLTIPAVGPDRLRRLLAEHAYCYRVRKDKNDNLIETSGLPSVSTARAALSAHQWNGVRQLAGVVSMPIVRPDGSIGTTRGYDPATKLYYWPRYAVPQVPERPSAEQVEEAKRFLLGELLADFPWDSPASRANYVAALFTPLLRLYIGGLAPLCLISAATRGSGKSLLAEIIRAAYGAHMTTWSRREEEFKKAITGVLRDSTEPVVVFDNVEVTDTLAHGALSKLLTLDEWSERILGVSNSVTLVNDRLWIATGNNIAVGGDVASRAVLTRLDPQMERPEERTDFHIEEDIWQWLGRDQNRSRVLWSLLVLARAWLVDGAPQAERPMRNFTRWAKTMGGLVTWLGLEGFLANADRLTIGSDDGETTTALFITKWFDKFGDRWVTTKELCESARIDQAAGHVYDPWDGAFLSREERGQTIPFSSKSLGKFLSGREDRIFSGLKLCRSERPVANTWQWRVQKITP